MPQGTNARIPYGCNYSATRPGADELASAVRNGCRYQRSRSRPPSPAKDIGGGHHQSKRGQLPAPSLFPGSALVHGIGQLVFRIGFSCSPVFFAPGDNTHLALTVGETEGKWRRGAISDPGADPPGKGRSALLPAL